MRMGLGFALCWVKCKTRLTGQHEGPVGRRVGEWGPPPELVLRLLLDGAQIGIAPKGVENSNPRKQFMFFQRHCPNPMLAVLVHRARGMEILRTCLEHGSDCVPQWLNIGSLRLPMAKKQQNLMIERQS